MPPPKPYNKGNRYKEILAGYTDKELDTLCQIKRFMECIQGDPKFRDLADKNPNDDGLHDRLKQIGVTIDMTEIMHFWKTEFAGKLIEYQNDPKGGMDSYPGLQEELDKIPHLKLWEKWNRELTDWYKNRSTNHELKGKSSAFNAWRRRRIASAKSELGFFGTMIDHPLFAFELCAGCSVQCWFCGFSAEKLTRVFEYTDENRAFFRDVAQAGVDIFGPMAGFALLYYATEPFDNPNYIDFMRDFEEITGNPVCTATAVPNKNPDWFRSLITFYRKRNLPWPRVSVLSTGMLRKLHELYTPLECRDVRLLMQMRDALRHKAVSGKTMGTDRDKLGYTQEKVDDLDIIPQGSIACVSGFYVNMQQKWIQLISPCNAYERWPKGYRVFDRQTFTDAADYKQKIQDMIARNMKENIAPDTRLGFRDDIKFSKQPDGFTLITPNQRHHFKGDPFLRHLGERISSSTLTYSQVYDQVNEKHPGSLFAIPGTVKDIFDKGLLDETLF